MAEPPSKSQINEIPDSLEDHDPIRIDQKGRIILPNGQRYLIKHICLGGKHYTLDHPFTDEQLRAIKKVITSTFTPSFQEEISHLNEVKKLTISQATNAAKPPLVEIKVTHSDGETTTYEAQLSLLHSLSHMTRIFEDLQKPADRYITDTHEMKDNQKVSYSFSEKLTRESTLLESLAFHRAMIAQITEWGNRNTPELIYHQEQIRLIQSYLKLNKQKDWLPSPYFRQVLNQQEKIDYVTASKHCIAAPVNMRYHDLSIKGQRQVGFYQVGVFSDMRNGWYSLKDLKTIKETQIIDGKLFKSIDPYIRKKKFGKSLTDKQVQSAQAARGHLVRIQTELKSNKTSALDEMIAERRRFLQTQMVQLVAAQARMNPDLIENGQFNLIHLCWLNHTLKSLDPSGWMHDERVEMEDMAEIFKEFNGKKLIFDGSGPRLDKDTIFLPLQEGIDNKTAITLNTFFFSTTVQGHKKNDKEQAAINLENLQAVKAKFPHFFQGTDLEARLQPNKPSNYTLAEDLMYLFLKKFAVSGGCLSAKDRTGFVTARIIQRYIADYMMTKVSTYKNNFKRKLLSETGVTLTNIRENTPDFDGIKVDVRSDLPGLNPYDKLKIVTKQITSTIQMTIPNGQFQKEERKLDKHKFHLLEIERELANHESYDREV